MPNCKVDSATFAETTWIHLKKLVIRNFFNEHYFYFLFKEVYEIIKKSYVRIPFKFSTKNFQIKNRGLIINILLFLVNVIKLYMLINVCFKFKCFCVDLLFFLSLKVTEIGFRVEIFPPCLTRRLWRYASS